MKQVIILHGGYTYSSKDAYLQHLRDAPLDYARLLFSGIKWREWISTQLSEREVLLPSMPCKDNADYDEWKIYFEKIIPFLKNDVIIIGHSLGAMFLVKYFQEKTIPQIVTKLVLVAPCYNDDSTEDLGSFRIHSATNVGERQNIDEVHLLFSKDDPVIPFTEAAKFQEDIPNAKIHVFNSYGHFNTSTFPELLELIKQK